MLRRISMAVCLLLVPLLAHAEGGPGSWETVSNAWAATESMTAMDGVLYVICNGLYRVDPTTGKYARLGTGEWKNTRYMTGLGGRLYMVQDATLYETTTAGAWKQMKGDWSRTTSMTALDGVLYIVCEGLWRVDPTTGAYVRLGTGQWKGTANMVGLAGRLFMVDDGTIWETSTAGVWKSLSKDWAATESITAANGVLYVVCNGLYVVNAKTGTFARLGKGEWKGTRAMTAIADHLYMVQDGTIYRTATR